MVAAGRDVTAAPSNGPRLYGGWRLRRGIGLWGLDATSTAVVLGSVLVPLLLAAASPRFGVISVIPALVLASLAALRVRGAPLSRHLGKRLRWNHAARKGLRSRRYGPNAAATSGRVRRGAAPGTGSWPAPLSALDLHEVTGARGQHFAVVHDVSSGSLTAAVRCAASSAWLVDRDDSDGWVTAWHSWLASLGYLPSVRWVAVIVETAPEPGTALRDDIAARTDPSSPADARALLRELVSRSPGAAANVTTWVAITFDAARLDPQGSQPRRPVQDSGVPGANRPPAQASEVDRLLAGLETSLAGCGVTVLARAGASDLLEVVADAYDPMSRGLRPATTRRSPGAGGWSGSRNGWFDSGPVAVEEDWGHLQHDSGCSVSWGWQEAPRQHVTSDVLSRLHSPSRFPKRVALLYRPLPAAEAARMLESEVSAAAFRDALRRAQRRDETARDVADREQARQAAREEAVGAGVVLVSVYVTTTVSDPELLPSAVADVEARADQAKIRLRRLYGGQAVGFATTLPLGIHPAALTGSRGRGSGRR